MDRGVLFASLLLVAQIGCDDKSRATGARDAASIAHAKTSTRGFQHIDPKDAIPPPPDVAAAPRDAIKTKSGLAMKVLQKGTGDFSPSEWHYVDVQYVAWTAGGKMFDSTYQRGHPMTLRVASVIPGWTEGLKLMVVGEKRRLWIPEKLAYGNIPDHPDPNHPTFPRGDIVFDVHLLEIRETFQRPKPIPAPPDVAKPAAGAKRTKTGLTYKVLKKGPGKGRKPDILDFVTFHYSGWTPDGTNFDSSVARGPPATVRLANADTLPCWREALMMMKAGDKWRFWVPGELAYDKHPPAKGRKGPKGDVVFDLELLTIP